MNHFHAFYENEGYGGDIIDVNRPCPHETDCTLPDLRYVFTLQELIDFVPAFLNGLADELEARPLSVSPPTAEG